MENDKHRIENQKENRIYRDQLLSNEVQEILNVSAGTLQNLRITGVLPYTKIGGTIYYYHEDIMKVLEENKKKFDPSTGNSYYP